MIFAENCARHYKAGLQVIPLYRNEKRPCILDWSAYAIQKVDDATAVEWIGQYPDGNIGLALGPASGVMMIDIDTEDRTLEEKIIAILPPSPWRRKGKKGMMLAYKYTPIKTHRIRNASGETLVECLSARTQCVLPPSIHPETKAPYTANVELVDVLDQLVHLPENIEEMLRKVCADHGIKLSHSGWSKVTEFVSAGSRDTTLTEMAGLFAFAIVRGERTLKEAIGMLRSYHGTFIENAAGDPMDIDKHVQNLIRFLHRDVIDKNKVLPKGWDAGFDEQQLRAMGVELNRNHTEWSYQEIVDFLQDAFEKNPSGQGRADAVQDIIMRLARSPSINRIDEDRILRYIVDVAGLGVTLATYRGRLRDLRMGEVAGNDHSEIAEATIKDLKERYMLAHYGEKFMKWNGSHWEILDERVIKNHISENYGHLPACKKHNDILGIVRVIAFLLPGEIQTTKMRGVNFANGFLTTELKLLPHLPEYGMTYTLPFRYMKTEAGRFPRFQKLLDSYWKDDEDFYEKCDALQEAMAVTLFGQGSRFQRAILLHGVPGSGKTQLLRIIESLIPVEGRCSVPPDMWGDKFMPATMHKKILNIVGELSDKKKIDGQSFKDIIDGSSRSAQNKNAAIFIMVPILTHWFASNHLPKTTDTSYGFIRRWLFLNFPRSVPQDKVELEIGDMIAAEEREAIVAWAVEAQLRLEKNQKYTLPASHRQLEKEFANVNNTVRLFLIESHKVRMKEAPENFVQEAKLYNAYWGFTNTSGSQRPVGLPQFRMMMRELGPELGFQVRITPTVGGATDCNYDGMVLMA